MTVFDTAIVGGGASGLFAAALLSEKGRSVVLLEKQPRVGRKLLATGNGRCNMTNMRAAAQNYHGSRAAVQSMLTQFSPADVRDVFARLGVETVEDAEGRVYPRSNLAASVLDGLRLFADEHGVQTHTDCAVTKITRTKNGFMLKAADEDIAARTVLLCTGGLAAPKLGACGDGYALLTALGHKTNPRFAAIAPLKSDKNALRGLKGQRLQGTIRLCAGKKTLREETGEILFGEDTVSGIAAMQCARVAQNIQGGALHIAIAPFGTVEKRASLLPERRLEDFLSGLVPKRVGLALLRAADIADMERPARTLTAAEKNRLAAVLNDWVLPITGAQGFDAAQVTAGGIALDDFDVTTMQSLRVRGLFAAGEVLDVDGDCGGFNLQWAFGSAALAARGILRTI